MSQPVPLNASTESARIDQQPSGVPSATPSTARPSDSRHPFACTQCDNRWGGLRTEHCKACHQTFSGTSAGDMHRTGKHSLTEGPDRRRCLTADEMQDKGMALNARGVWTTGQSDPRFKENRA